MKDEYLQQALQHVQHFFAEAKLHKKKWYREIHDTDVWLYAFFVIRRRMLQSRRYIVHESNRFHEVSPKPEVARDYAALKHAWTEKGDLKKFHTENSKILYPIDGLLEDWGINHLHVDRARYQVFFRVEGNDIYVLKTVNHFGRGHMGYSKESLLQIMEENWPGRFQKSRLPNPTHAAASAQYPSRYGWQRVADFYRWLEEQTNLISGEKVELALVENERFVLRNANGETSGIPFDV